MFYYGYYFGEYYRVYALSLGKVYKNNCKWVLVVLHLGIGM